LLQERDLTRLPLVERRELMRSLLKLSSPRIHISEHIEASASDLLSVVREQGLEGIVAKRRDSLYEPGKRTGAWIKRRVNLGQEFVIGGYTPGPHSVDAIIVGYYREKDLIYVARTRNGFVPASRGRVFDDACSVTADVLSETDFVGEGFVWTRELQSNSRWNPTFDPLLLGFPVICAIPWRFRARSLAPLQRTFALR
jgi:ATP dependent DNA ligase domain